MRWQITLFICFWLQRTDNAMGDSTAEVAETTSSRVKIIWNTPQIKDPMLEPNIFSLYYRSECDVYVPATLERNMTSLGYHIARPARKLSQDCGRYGSSIIWAEVLNETCVRITVDKLKIPDCVYRFNISTRRLGAENKIGENISILVRTKPADPYPFRFANGSFHVYELNDEEARRKVKIFWQPRIDARNYLVRVHSKSADGEPVYMAEISQAQGCLMLDIGLQAHVVVVRLIQRNWISAEYAELNIPAQEDILPAPTSKIRWMQAQNVTLLKWRPQYEYDVNVTSYTVFWLDTLDGVASQRIFDFVNVSPEIDWFLLSGNNKFTFLGLSVNSESASSGLQLPCWRYE